MSNPTDAHTTLPFRDASGAGARTSPIWPPLLITKEMIDAEVERLAALPRPANGVRASRIVHPASQTATGFAPGTDVTIHVLRPGETSVARRGNAGQVEISLRGGGSIDVDRGLTVAQHDVWTLPPMRSYAHRNPGKDLWVRLTYSNAPLLEMLGALFEEQGDAIGRAESLDDGLSERQRRVYAWENAPDLPLTPAGARLRAYEFLTDIPVIDNPALHWPWPLVREHLSSESGDGKRNIFVLYHPATERRSGTTNTFFATLADFPPGSPRYPGTRGHRHTSAAINYHLRGHGESVVDGVRVPWKAGDLLLSAPSWSEHAHYHGDEGWTVLTVQDHPLHIAMGSLLWQERYDGPIRALGEIEGQKGYVGPRQQGQ